MRVQVTKLREVLDLLTPVVPKKSNLPVLSHVLLQDGEVIATDLETMVIVDLPEVEGEYLIPYQPVAKLLKYVPGGDDLVIERKDKNLNLSWQDGNASYEAADLEEYPPMPEVEVKAESTVDGDTLVTALTSVVGYCATDETRPVLCGVFLCLGEAVELCAADGFRLAYQALPFTFPSEGNIVIPAKAVHLLQHLWKKIPVEVCSEDSLVEIATARKNLEMALSSELLKLNFGPVTMVVKLIQGTPPTWRNLLPSEEAPLKVRVFAPEMERAIRRVRGVAQKGQGGVRLVWSEDTMTISAQNDEQKVEAIVPVQAEGGSGRIALNVSYLLDYFQGKEGLVSVGVTSNQGPVSFQYRQSPLVLIMPMSVQW